MAAALRRHAHSDRLHVPPLHPTTDEATLLIPQVQPQTPVPMIMVGYIKCVNTEKDKNLAQGLRLLWRY